jgi:hypothetical protein
VAWAKYEDTHNEKIYDKIIEYHLQISVRLNTMWYTEFFSEKIFGDSSQGMYWFALVKSMDIFLIHGLTESEEAFSRDKSPIPNQFHPYSLLYFMTFVTPYISWMTKNVERMTGQEADVYSTLHDASYSAFAALEVLARNVHAIDLRGDELLGGDSMREALTLKKFQKAIVGALRLDTWIKEMDQENFARSVMGLLGNLPVGMIMGDPTTSPTSKKKPKKDAFPEEDLDAD